eukprot:1735407-Prymnesium_polylepis.2
MAECDTRALIAAHQQRRHTQRAEANTGARTLQLRAFVAAADMEALLERLQRTAKESSVLEEAQQEWEASHPVSAALILTPGTCRSS